MSMISQDYLYNNHPNSKTKELAEFLENELRLTTGNGGVISYIGWVELEFGLSSGTNEVMAPFIVTNEAMQGWI